MTVHPVHRQHTHFLVVVVAMRALALATVMTTTTTVVAVMTTVVMIVAMVVPTVVPVTVAAALVAAADVAAGVQFNRIKNHLEICPKNGPKVKLERMPVTCMNCFTSYTAIIIKNCPNNCLTNLPNG